MTRSDWYRLLVCVAAVAFPWCALQGLTDSTRANAGMSYPPFALPRLLAAHLALSLPLALLLGSWLKNNAALRDAGRGWWVGLGLVSLGLAAWLGPTLPVGGLLYMTILRSFLSIILVLPWCLLISTPASRSRSSWEGRALFLGALGLAMLPCGLLTDALRTARVEQTRELLERERLERARQNVWILRELGGGVTIGKEKLDELLARLNHQLQALDRQVSRPLPTNAPEALRLERALLLIPLNRLDESAKLLLLLADGRNLATLLLATVYQEQQRWADSDARFESVLNAQIGEAATKSEAREACRMALEGLVFNAREERRPADVERWLRRSLELFPERAAELHFQFGQHFAHAGNPHRAIEEFHQAATLNPQRFQRRAQHEIDQLRASTPACLLRFFQRDE